jgi:hypothetical protein
MTNVLSGSASFSTTSLAVTPYFPVVSPLNPDGTPITTDIDSHIQKSAEANNTIVACQSVSNAAGDRDLVRWYKIAIVNGTPTLDPSDGGDQGNVGDGATLAGSSGSYNVYDVYPAIDINAAGTIAMTYTQSAASFGPYVGQFMSSFITGRVASDAAGTMQAPVLVQAVGRTTSMAAKAT